MGWASGGDIFDPVATAILNSSMTDKEKTDVLSILISALQEGDWDTEDESLAAFREYPAAVEAFQINRVEEVEWDDCF